MRTQPLRRPALPWPRDRYAVGKAGSDEIHTSRKIRQAAPGANSLTLESVPAISAGDAQSPKSRPYGGSYRSSHRCKRHLVNR